MGVAAEAGEEAVHLLVDHRVIGHAMVEVGLLRGGRQFAVEQEIAGLEKIAVLGELLDRIAAIEEDALVAVDEGDLGFAGRGRGEARIVGEAAGLAVERGDIDDLRPERAVRARRNPSFPHSIVRLAVLMFAAPPSAATSQGFHFARIGHGSLHVLVGVSELAGIILLRRGKSMRH